MEDSNLESLVSSQSQNTGAQHVGLELDDYGAEVYHNTPSSRKLQQHGIGALQRQGAPNHQSHIGHIACSHR